MPKDLCVFYVYILFDWLGIPRYVGKGKNSRWLDHEKSSNTSNPLMNEFIERTWIMLGEVPKIKVREKLIEAGALKIEITLIDAIGRLDQGKGPLLNLTDGGEGLSGHIFSKRTRELLSKNAKAYMDKLSPEERSRRARLGYDSMTEEQKINRLLLAAKSTTRSESIRQYLASLTPEERSERARKGYAGRPQELKNTAEKWHAMMTPEKLANLSKTVIEQIHLKSTPGERSIRASQRESRKDPEQRRLSAQKGVETRIKRGTDKNLHSTERRREIALKGWATRKLKKPSSELPVQEPPTDAR